MRRRQESLLDERCWNCNLTASRSASGGTTSRPTTSNRKLVREERIPGRKLVPAQWRARSWAVFLAAAKGRRLGRLQERVRAAECKRPARSRTSNYRRRKF